MARAALALGAGFCVALSLPPWGWWPLAFLGIALFEVALDEHPSGRDRLVRGMLFGAGWLFPGMGWMWFLTAPGYVLATLLFAGLHGLAALVSPTGPWRVIGRPAAHAVVEGLRLAIPFGGVPLATIAIGQAGGPLVGVARVGGVILLSWLVLQVGFALGAFVTNRSDAGEPAAAGPRTGILRTTALAAAAGVVLLAAAAPEGVATGPLLRVAAVQGGGPQGTLAINSDSRKVVERHLAATAGIAPGSADLVVWPENVIDVEVFADSRERTEVAAEAARIGAPFAVGITEDVAPGQLGTDPSGRGGFLNAQVVVTPDGEVTSRYDKVRRVPFGEYMPMRDLLASIGAPVDQVPRDAVAGTGPAVLDLPDGTRLAVVISWEVFFGSRARDGVRNGGELVLNPTNGSSYTGTILQTQQVASSRLRAVESGRWVVQVSPTGFSAFVGPDGTVYDRTAVSEQAVITHTVALRSGRTWYTALGNPPFLLAALGVLALSLAAARRFRVPASP
jgi:apolipoprotein N-acyltransferase